MPMFDVFVEGPVDRAPGAVQRLAAAIAAHYGVPADAIAARLAQGKFRVKTRCDQPTASVYLRDLTALGAKVSVVASDPAPAAGPPARPSGPYLPTPVPGAMKAPQPPRTVTPASVLPPQPPRTVTPASVLPPQPSNAAKAPTSPLPPSALPPADPDRPAASGAFASGLAAAYSGEIPTAGLGAIEDGALSLAALDGTEDPGAVNITFAPTTSALPASMGPPAQIAAPAAPAPRSSQPSTPPVDLFAPPGADDDELAVEIAPEDRPRATTPPATVAASPAPEPSRAPPPGPAVAVTAAPGPPRWRFAAGVVLAVVIGFVPAHVVASIREGSVDREIDDHVVEVQAQVGSPDAAVPYDALDGFRAGEADRKRAAHRDIALLAFGIWAAAAAGVGYVWFRRIPWRRD